MTDMKVGVVMPIGGNRLDFAKIATNSIAEGVRRPEGFVFVADGFDGELFCPETNGIPYSVVSILKHAPGMEQPRNIGVRVLTERFPDCTHVWFVDSDVIMDAAALYSFEYIYSLIKPEVDRDPIMIAPYDWMPPGHREPLRALRNDPRWPLFEECAHGRTVTGLNVALACFSGNLIWPIEEFTKLGGFWNEIYHGRCEDGELGLRSFASGMHYTLVREARGWHMDHPRNHDWIRAANSRDVPLINERHPWVQDYGVFVADRDGKTFYQYCLKCDKHVSTVEWWTHYSVCSIADDPSSSHSDMAIRVVHSQQEKGVE